MKKNPIQAYFIALLIALMLLPALTFAGGCDDLSVNFINKSSRGVALKLRDSNDDFIAKDRYLTVESGEHLALNLVVNNGSNPNIFLVFQVRSTVPYDKTRLLPTARGILWSGGHSYRYFKYNMEIHKYYYDNANPTSYNGQIDVKTPDSYGWKFPYTISYENKYDGDPTHGIPGSIDVIFADNK